MMNVKVIRGMPLPPEIVLAMEEGRWRSPHRAVWAAAFPGFELDDPHLLQHTLVSENAAWPSETGKWFLGSLVHGAIPGTIDPARSVLIAGFGHDLPIALDYRRSTDSPAVVAYRSEGENRYWVQIAANAEEFLQKLMIG